MTRPLSLTKPLFLTVTDAAAYDVGTPATATGTITNDDTGPVVNFSIASQSVSEAGQSVTITVRLSRASNQAVSIPFTVGGTASRNSDYSINASPLVFAAGQTEANITVTPINDVNREGTEQVIVSLGQPSGATLGTLVSHTLSILDDESVESRIITPSLVARPHAIPANSLPTAIMFQAVTSSTVTVFPIGSVSGVESIRILDGDLGDISFVSQGLTTANVEAGKIYAILFGSQATEQLYTVRSSLGSSAIAHAPTNIFEPTDVSADGQTTALDALQIINQMNIVSAAEGEQGSATGSYMDVNRDGRVSAQDALEVIHKLNRQSALSLAHGEEMIPLAINAAQYESKDATSEYLEFESTGAMKIVSLASTFRKEPTKLALMQDSTDASNQRESDIDSEMSSVDDFIELMD